ncbi:MAG: carbohydrate kinase family protein [Parasporobacterium sp.]|nr:carbohydrate kinase family protein [Parasporobacterium sp.]
MEIKNLIDPARKIVVIGTVFMDIKGYPEGAFNPVGRNVGRIEYKYGGVARNVADDLAGLGIRPFFVSMIDEDGPGGAILDHLVEAGVNSEYVLRRPDCIGTWMVILNPQGDVCANLSRRQDLLPLHEVLECKGDEIFQNADGVLLEMDVEERIVEDVFHLAQKHHTRVYGVISNINIALERMPYIRRTGCVICNRQEAGVMFGHDTGDLSAPELLQLLKKGMTETGIQAMVITMDKDGAVYAGYGEGGHCKAEQVTVVDSTGAGDAFFAGVCAGLISNVPLSQACRIGTGMAAKVIQSRENVYR